MKKPEKRGLKQSLLILWKIHRYIFPYIDKVVVYLLCGAIGVILGLFTPLITMLLIDEAFANRDFQMFWSLIGFGVILTALGGFLGLVSSRLGSFVSQQVSLQLSRDVYNRLRSHCLRYIQAKQVGDHIERVTASVSSVAGLISDTIPSLVTTSVSFIGTLIIALTLDWRVTLMAFGIVPFHWLHSKIFTPILFKYQKLQREKSAQRNSHLQESMVGFKDIRAMGQDDLEVERFNFFTCNLAWIDLNVHFLTMGSSGLLSIISYAWSMGIMVFMGYQILLGSMTVGLFMALVIYVFDLPKDLSRFKGIVDSTWLSFVSLDRLLEIFETPVETKESLNSIFLPDNTDGALEFRNVSFSYTSGVPVLKDISFKIPAGAKVGIVGPNGAGKSTLIALLLRLYDPESGQVLIDGINLKDIKHVSLRKHVGVVFQDHYIFMGSIADNLAMAKPDATKQEMLEAVEKAGLGNFVRALPKGLNTFIHERGQSLSGGQRQKLAVARLLLKNPTITIFDEAYSAQDTEGALSFRQLITELFKDKTCFVISHQYGPVLSCDRILYLQDGCIKEQGTVEELLELKGRFWQDYVIQKSILVSTEKVETMITAIK